VLTSRASCCSISCRRSLSRAGFGVINPKLLVRETALAVATKGPVSMQCLDTVSYVTPVGMRKWVRDFLPANPSKPQSFFVRVCNRADQRYASCPHPRGQPLARAARVSKTSKLAAPKISSTHSGSSAPTCRHVRCARDHATDAAHSRKNAAPPALVSFIAVPQSMEVPLRGPLHTHRAFSFPPFDP